MSRRALRLLIVSERSGAASRLRLRLGQNAAGFEVEEVADLEAAERRIAQDATDAVAIEVDAEVDESAAALRRLTRLFPRLPFLVLADPASPAALAAIRAGAQDCLPLDEGGASPASTLFRAVERQRREWRVRCERDRLALALEGARQGVWEWNLRTDRVIYAAGWRRLLGFGGPEIGVGVEEWLGRVHPADLDALKRQISGYLTSRSERLENEHRIRDARGRYRWVLCRAVAVRGEDGTVVRMVGTLCDINRRKVREEQLLHDALHDGLTGSANSALLMDRLAVALAQTSREAEGGFALLFFDLDRFKKVNDTFGHAMGDRLLAGVALRLQTLVRPGDTVARLGGDEFAIIAHGVDQPSDATRIAERIHDELKRPFELDEHIVQTSCSIGIALSGGGYERPRDMLRDADTAMYRAKNLGRGRHAIFDEEMHRRATEFLELETELRDAIQEGQLELRYQPIVALRSGRLEGFEALVRWHHPRRGLLQPDEFIPVAEDTGLIVPLGWSVLGEACGQMATWHRQLPDARHLGVRVNLSERQFLHPELVERLEGVLARTGLAPGRLGLEIPEATIAAGSGVAERLRRLHRLGVALHIDEFGTGHCSLAFLHELPAQTLEIDRSLVRWVAAREEAPAVLSSIVSLARSLGMQVAAEGLETHAQLAHLRRLECEFGQGYYFSRPLESEAARELIGRRPSWN